MSIEFREEVLKNKKNKLWGEVLISPTPFYWKSFTALTISAFLGLIMLFMSHYSLKETVQAVIVPNKGSVTLTAPVHGYVQLQTELGELVDNQSPLLSISEHPHTLSGQDFDKNYKQLLLDDQNRLQEKKALIENQKILQISQLILETENKKKDLKHAYAQLDLCESNLQALLERKETLQIALDKGGISLAQFKDFEAKLRQAQQENLSSSQSIEQITIEMQALTLKKQNIEQAAYEQKIALEQQQSDIGKLLYDFDRKEGSTLFSPEEMKVTHLDIKSGQHVQAGQSLMVLEYPDDYYIAQLSIPEKAIGLIEEGMEVNLRLHSYPYEHYGILKGILTDISQSAILDPQTGNYIYIAQVTLASQYIYGNAKTYKLRQGLIAQADIKTQKLTLIDKLLEPLKRFKRV